MLLCFPTATIIRVPIRIHAASRPAVTRKTNTSIIEVTESPSMRIIVGIKMGRVNGEIHIVRVVLVKPVVHQGVQQVEVVGHGCQPAVVDVLMRVATTRTYSPHDGDLLRLHHLFEQARVQRILLIRETLTCSMS